MAISLTEDFKTIEELREDPDAVLKQARKTGRPVVVTARGKPDVVILDAAVYESRLKAVNMARLIAEAEASARAQGTRPVEEFMDELYHEKKLPRRNRARRRT
jgi:prevent-host-death family protein